MRVTQEPGETFVLRTYLRKGRREMWDALVCALASVASLAFAGPETDFYCIAQEDSQAFWVENYGVDDPGAVGWYDMGRDEIYLVQGLSLTYSVEVVAHEAAHAFDWKRGERSRFWSQDHTDLDVEEYARLVTLATGWWPRDEVFPDEAPSEEVMEWMWDSGWFPAWEVRT